VSVRVIAATNRNLEQEVDAGHFRRDLFFRLSVFPLKVPPLRERLEDIPVLASSFLEQAARRMHSAIPTLTREHVQELTTYPWPGNVRELQNVIERAVILARGGTLHFGLNQAGGPSVPGTTPSACFDPQAASRTRTAEDRRSAPTERRKDLWRRWCRRATRHASDHSHIKNCGAENQTTLNSGLSGDGENLGALCAGGRCLVECP
jgi:transcriptional regulator with GAF, ATPase, and Fis domain